MSEPEFMELRELGELRERRGMVGAIPCGCPLV
jgi:hypothetical protein